MRLMKEVFPLESKVISVPQSKIKNPPQMRRAIFAEIT